MKLTQTLLNEDGVTDGILLWVTVAIIIIIALPVINGIINASPKIVTSSLDVGNLTGGGGVLGTSAINSTQGNLITMVSSSYGLLIVVLIVIAAVVILGVVAYLRAGRQ
jgi:hypothetical protein